MRPKKLGHEVASLNTALIKGNHWLREERAQENGKQAREFQRIETNETFEKIIQYCKVWSTTANIHKT